jgi:hypothetical protein
MLLCATAVGQENELMRILENQASDEAGEMEEDIQQWQYLKKHPLNLNTAGVEEFSVFAIYYSVVDTETGVIPQTIGKSC